MGETTGITWCDATFNPWWGCIRVSPGCEHCYAETFTHRMGMMSLWGPYQRRFFGDKHWSEPVRWNAAAEKEARRKRVFCASMADVFEKFDGLDEQRTRLWDLITVTTNLDWLILTKRPENIGAMLPTEWLENPPGNVRLGVTAEDQENADKRIPLLLDAWAGKNFLSVEPMIDIVKIPDWLGIIWEFDFSHNRWIYRKLADEPRINWIICGGESGAGCRHMDVEWARNLKAQCKAAEIPFFMKQLGGHPDKRHEPAEWPKDLRMQEFPEVEG